MKLVELTGYLDRVLELEKFSGDHSNNGLQIEGGPEVRKAVFGVDGSLALFRAATERKADFVFVHHGISWGGEPRRFTGFTADRLRLMFQHGISLYAAHLPLDANSEFGNNAELAKLAGLAGLEPFCRYDGAEIGFIGSAAEILTAPALAVRLEQRLGSKAQLCAAPSGPLRRIAVVSGGGGMDALFDAAERKADLLLTGELTQVMFHPAHELGVGVLALGHYATETVGPLALMRKVQRDLRLECEFVDLPTGL